MKVPRSYRHLRIALFLVLGVLVLSTIGYMLIESLSFPDALYTAIQMMATVGNVVRPLSETGRFFTLFVIVLGVGALLYAFGSSMEFIIEGHFGQAMRRYFMEKNIAALNNHYIICGMGRVGSHIAQDLAASKVRFVVIDERESTIEACTRLGYLTVQGDATTDDTLTRAGVANARGVLVATDDDSHNISITLSARHLNSKLFIVARANHDETEAKLKLAGADRIHSPYNASGHRMSNLALQPGVTEVLDNLTRAGNVELSVQEVQLTHSSRLTGETVGDVQSALGDGIMLLALKKPGGLVLGSRLDAHIDDGDTAIVVGRPEQLTAFRQRNEA
jgi:voltage-gated potassium channel